MKFRVEFDPGAERELEKLDPQIARRILKFLYERVLGLVTREPSELHFQVLVWGSYGSIA